ncbi:MAG: hypothetical protein ACKOUQ_08565, partial [Aquirufa sp.]
VSPYLRTKRIEGVTHHKIANRRRLKPGIFIKHPIYFDVPRAFFDVHFEVFILLLSEERGSKQDKKEPDVFFHSCNLAKIP